MAKRTTLAEIGETLAFIVERMSTKGDLNNVATKDDLKQFATKDDMRQMLKPIETRLTAIEGKIDGIDKRLDIDAIKRDHEKLPVRVADLEQELFGKSRAPQRPAM